MKKILGIELTDKDFDYFICEQNKGKQLKAENGKIIAFDYVLTEEDINEQKINEIKQKLLDTDYQAIKYAEGAITAEDYAETKAQRQAWRDEINQLEK